MSFPAAVTQETRAIRPCRKFEGHTGLVRGVIHLPGGHRTMTCSGDGSLRVWDLHSGKQIGNDWRDGESAVYAIGLSPDGKKVVSGSDDSAVRVWDIDAGRVVAKWTGHTGHIVSVCWDRGGGRVVSWSCEVGTARVWDVESGKTVLVVETGLKNVWAMTYSPDTTMIATGGHSYDGADVKIRVWDVKTGKLVANLEGHTSGVECLAWTADGKTLISGSMDHSIRTWNTTTWQQVAVLTGHTNVIHGIAISPNGRIIASASYDDTVRLWNLENGQVIGSPLQHADQVYCASFSTDGKSLATGCSSGNAYMWDISAIAEEAGFSDLLNPNDKSLLHAGATRHRGDWRRNPYPGPSSDTPHHQLSPRHNITISSARQQYDSAHLSSRLHALPGRTSPFQRNNYNTEDIPTQPRFLRWARIPFFNNQINEGIELQERHREVVDVPLGQARPRIYSRREVEMD